MAVSTPTVTVRVTDDNGLRHRQRDGDVNNVAPIVGAVTAPVDPMPGARPSAPARPSAIPALSIRTRPSGSGVIAPSSPATVAEYSGSGSASGTHIYPNAGVYTLTLVLTDNDGGCATSTFQYVVVYDPAGGFVTGGGWITSPAGAYAADPALTGKATFGFVSKYKKGATVPTGTPSSSSRRPT